MAAENPENDEDCWVDEPAQAFLLEHEKLGQSSPAAGEGANVNPTAATSADEACESAIDDSDEVSDRFAMLQISRERKRREADQAVKRQATFPFKFSPNIRPLSVSNVDACVALENAALTEPEHRATPEKFKYRLSVCPELGVGLFCTIAPDQAKDWGIETMPFARPAETGRPNGALSVLLAHIVATKSLGQVVTDSDMGVPENWRNKQSGPLNTQKQQVGHQEAGRTIALHSLCVSPKAQALGIGKMILKDYLQRMAGSGLADRVALLSQDYNVEFYQRMGFANHGMSKTQFAGGGWFDMVYELST